jgi:hypothetical protein
VRAIRARNYIPAQHLRGDATILGVLSAKRTVKARSVWWPNSDFVVHGILNPLFATEISFRCLNRNVTEQKLDLLQFASGGVAKPCTGSAEIVRR